MICLVCFVTAKQIDKAPMLRNPANPMNAFAKVILSLYRASPLMMLIALYEDRMNEERLIFKYPEHDPDEKIVIKKKTENTFRYYISTNVYWFI